MGLFGGGGSAQEQVDLSAVNDRIAKLEAAVASLQNQVAALSAAPAAAPNPLAGTDPGAVPYSGNVANGGPWLEEVRALKAQGKLINAIKLYRENTGVGLKEAKDTVEGMA